MPDVTGAGTGAGGAGAGGTGAAGGTGGSDPPKPPNGGNGGQGGAGAGAGGGAGGDGPPKPPEPPKAPKGVFITLSPEQQRQAAEGKLFLTDDAFTGTVRSRIDGLNASIAERDSALAKAKAADEKRREEELREQGKWQEVATLAATKATAAETAVQSLAVNTAFLFAASAKGIHDIPGALAIARTMPEFGESVTVEGGIENPTVSGIESIVDALVEQKPYLVGSQSGGGTRTSVGSPSTPGGKPTIEKPKNLAEAGDRLQEILSGGNVEEALAALQAESGQSVAGQRDTTT